MLAAVDVYIIFVSENGVTTLLDALLCKFEGGSGVKVSPSRSCSLLSGTLSGY